MKTKIWSRRGFLEKIGLGASATALAPFLPTTEEAHAQGAFPKRLIIVHGINGGIANMDHFRPTGTERSWTLSPMLAPLAPWKSKIVVIDGVDNQARYELPLDGHQGAACLWTGISPRSIPTTGEPNGGHAMGPSVDQIVAKRIGTTTKFPSLTLGVGVGGSYLNSQVFNRDVNQWIPPELSPPRLFGQLFADLDAVPADLAARKLRRQTVLDSVRADLGSLKSRLGAADRVRLDAHLSGVALLEKQLSIDFGANCSAPAAPPSSLVARTQASMDSPAVLDWHQDLAAQALKCDLTRVVGVQVFRSGSSGTMTFLGHTAKNIHEYSHDTLGSATDMAQYAAFTHWNIQKLARLLEKLDAVREGDGTLLDSTLVVWGNELGVSAVHGGRNCPVIMAQGKYAAFQTDRYMRFGNYQMPTTRSPNPTSPPQAPHGGEPNNRVLVSICRAMGLGDVNVVGDPKYPQGPLPGLV